jgi:enoyl-[acyl-carrier protein] reductase I
MSEKPLEGKTALVTGVANKRSIAWGVARAWHNAGARIIYSYQGDRLKDSVYKLAKELDPDPILLECDVATDEAMERFAADLKEATSDIHCLLHSIAFANREALEGSFLNTTREQFRVAHDISAYSLIALTRAASPLMSDGGAVVAMTFLGSNRVIPNYNVMGVAKASLEATTRYLAYTMAERNIRVNAISAGPIMTLAGRGISQFPLMLKHYEKHAPMHRSCDQEEVGETATFLVSPGASAITGQVMYVDAGYTIMGM